MNENQLIVCLSNILFLMMSHINCFKRKHAQLEIDLQVWKIIPELS